MARAENAPGVIQRMLAHRAQQDFSLQARLDVNRDLSTNLTTRVCLGMYIDVPLATQQVIGLLWRNSGIPRDGTFHAAFESQDDPRILTRLRWAMKAMQFEKGWQAAQLLNAA